MIRTALDLRLIIGRGPYLEMWHVGTTLRLGAASEQTSSAPLG